MGCKWLQQHLQSQSQPHLPAVHPAQDTNEALTHPWSPQQTLKTPTGVEGNSALPVEGSVAFVIKMGTPRTKKGQGWIRKKWFKGSRNQVFDWIGPLNFF
ncbi:hypothetical protein PYW07_013515 [Mythimna separata]|uniref:Uncharacterized protein n=1 Tax=Mythimna separata TaxID=271217 RepID=A0AAD8DMJ1_MYTSE|nr:hypothetical protein PYW07_013515 [Mythimna separata]